MHKTHSITHRDPYLVEPRSEVRLRRRSLHGNFVQISAVGLPTPEDAFKTFYWSVFYGVLQLTRFRSTELLVRWR